VSRHVRVLLRLEGLTVLVAGVALYAGLEASWLTFALLFFVPDVSMFGYLRNRRVGVTAYNLVHSYVGPALLGGLGWWYHHPLMMQLAVIWISHIGFDRLLGFGLKLPSGFADTHLGRSAGTLAGSEDTS
jgi:hypothetical protein